MATQKNLSNLPNIGKILEKKLQEVNITNIIELKSSQSKDIFVKIRAIDPKICLSALYALEGAIQGIRWHLLDNQIKNDLKKFYDSIRKQKQSRFRV